jgi:hypothetical protein
VTVPKIEGIGRRNARVLDLDKGGRHCTPLDDTVDLPDRVTTGNQAASKAKAPEQ